MSNLNDCLKKIQELEIKMVTMEALLNNQANILKYVVTPLIIVVGALSGINLVN